MPSLSSWAWERRLLWQRLVSLKSWQHSFSTSGGECPFSPPHSWCPPVSFSWSGCGLWSQQTVTGGQLAACLWCKTLPQKGCRYLGAGWSPHDYEDREWRRTHTTECPGHRERPRFMGFLLPRDAITPVLNNWWPQAGKGNGWWLNPFISLKATDKWGRWKKSPWETTAEQDEEACECEHACECVCPGVFLQLSFFSFPPPNRRCDRI